MKRFGEFIDRLRISGFLRWTIVVLIVLKAILVFARTAGGQTDTWNVTATSAATSHEFGILFGFLGILFVLLFFSIAVLLWLKRKEEPRGSHMLSAFGNAPASRAMETNFSLLSPQDHLARAGALTLASSQRDFPVVEDGRLVGMMMQEDLFTALRQAKDQVRVADVMRRGLSVVDFNDRLEDALNRLRTSGAHTLPVTKRNRLVGLLTMENAQEFFRIESATRADPEGVPRITKFSVENRRRPQPWLHGPNYASGM
jgi:predicted transcriptional regulator